MALSRVVQGSKSEMKVKESYADQASSSKMHVMWTRPLSFVRSFEWFFNSSHEHDNQHVSSHPRMRLSCNCNESCQTINDVVSNCQ